MWRIWNLQVAKHHVNIRVLHLTVVQEVMVSSPTSLEHMETGSMCTCVNTIRSDTSRAVRRGWEACESTACQILKVSSFHTKRSDELMCESRNDSEAAGTVWVDSPCRRWKYLQPKWLELQTSELKASDSIYCFRYPRSGVPLWSI